MTELGFAAYMDAVCPALMKHSKKEDLLASFLNLIDKDDLKSLHAGDDLALFLAETFIYAINRFSQSKAEDGHQRISVPLLVFTFFYAVSIFICTMATIIQLGEVSQPLMAFAFFFSLALFVFLIAFYFFLWRRDI